MDYSYIKSEKDTCRGTLVCIPGLAHTKEHFLKTPDGRAGWAFNLSSLGFDVYCMNWHNILTEQKLNSVFVIDAISNFITNEIKKDVILLTHSASGAFGWKLSEKNSLVKKVLAIAPAPPGNIQKIPSVIVSDDHKKISVLHLNAVPYTFSLDKDWTADIAWINQKAIGNSTTHFPRAFIKQYELSLVSVPSRILYERMNIEGSQIKINMDKFKENNPYIYIFTGDQDISHSYEVDKAIDDYFIENNIHSKMFWLADYGFRGNGHMLMLQDNSKEIIEFIVSQVG